MLLVGKIMGQAILKEIIYVIPNVICLYDFAQGNVFKKSS
jgi:hypothetical protein